MPVFVKWRGSALLRLCGLTQPRAAAAETGPELSERAGTPLALQATWSAPGGLPLAAGSPVATHCTHFRWQALRATNSNLDTRAEEGQRPRQHSSVKGLNKRSAEPATVQTLLAERRLRPHDDTSLSGQVGGPLVSTPLTREVPVGARSEGKLALSPHCRGALRTSPTKTDGRAPRRRHTAVCLSLSFLHISDSLDFLHNIHHL